MTVTIDKYLSLITSEHADKPNFRAVITAAGQPFVDAQNLIATITAKYDLDLAVGSQLDVVGQWVGISRRLAVPIPGVYFSQDILGIGFNEGIWFERGDPTQGVVNLDDATYRLMIRAKILANIWDGSLGMANAGLEAIFGAGAVQIIDNFDMTMSINVSGSVTSALVKELIDQGYIPLRPAGVKLEP